MSKLSFARIMYGTNEDLGTSPWMHSKSVQSPLHHSINGTNAAQENWVRRILRAVLPSRF
jgi:hypothetical protein